jgi:Cdc6-like AAA superfamily ATPase
VVVGLLLSQAHSARARNRRRKFEQIIGYHLAAATSRMSPALEVRNNTRLEGGQLSRNFDFVVYHGSRPILAVVSVYQTRQGGRQRDIILGLPQIQEDLAAQEITLVVVADGPGFSDLTRPVYQVAPQLRYFTNLHGLENSEFETAIAFTLSEDREYLPESRAARDEILTRITDLALRTGRPVDADVLGVSTQEADAFLLRYQAARPHYELIRVKDGSLLAGAHQSLEDITTQVRLLQTGETIDPFRMVDLIAKKLGYRVTHYPSQSDLHIFGLEGRETQLRLPSPLPLVIPTRTEDAAVSNTFQAIEQCLSRGPLIARLAILLDLLHPSLSRSFSRSFAAQGRSQTAVLDQRDLEELVLSTVTHSKQLFQQYLVRDIDLSLVSPFVSEGPTPPQMFYGRDLELRRVHEQIEGQSFALVGGRKAGKTSMLRRLLSDLSGRYPTAYIDCQAHPDRSDFLDYLLSESPSGQSINRSSSVSQSEAIIRNYIDHRFNGRFGVLLFDEVDALFASDSQAEVYPHVLSSALRSISQSSVASIVATGERSLFQLTRDPSSPHWNFCTPLEIGPLAPEAARNLLRGPLNALGVRITTEALTLAIERTSCHPNLLQFLGNKIVEAVTPQSKTADRLIVDREIVLDVSSQPEFRQRFVRTFWSQSTTLEKLISVHLSFTIGKNEPTLMEELVRTGITASYTDIAKSVEMLELYSIANVDSTGVRYSSQAVEEYLAPFLSTALVSQWVGELR